MKEELLTIQQAADFLGVSTKTLRRWEAKGILIPERTVGNQRRYTMSELVAFRQRSKNPAASAAQETVSDNASSTATTAAPISDTSIPTPPLSFQKLPDQPIIHSVNSNTEIPSQTFPNADFDKANFQPVQVQKTNVQDRVQVLGQELQRKTFFKMTILTVIALVFILITAKGANVFFSSKDGGNQNSGKNSSGVLAAQTKGKSLFGQIEFNVPAVFNDKIIVNGKSLFNEDVKVNNKNVDLGTGKLTASNVLYGITAGANITISGDPQNPTISAGDLGENSVTSFQGQTGAISLINGSGIGLNGLTISNTGVLSLGGQTGDVNLTAGDGISVSGTEITNDDPGSAQNIFKNVIVDATAFSAGSNGKKE